MADITKYTDWALEIEETSVPFAKDSLAVGNRERRDILKSGGTLRPDLVQVIGKRPIISATLLDPSVVTDWTTYSANSVIAVWRAYAENGGLGAGYISLTSGQGILVPVSMSGAANRHVQTQIEAHCLYDTDVALALGTTSKATASIAKAYYPTNVVINPGAAETITQMVDFTVNWNWAISDDDQLEPEYIYYPTMEMTATFRVKKLGAVSIARLEELSTESVSVLCTDANDDGNTTTIDLGSCLLKTEIAGEDCVITATKVG